MTFRFRHAKPVHRPGQPGITFYGALNSYAWVILVIHYLQTVPSPPILPLIDPQTLLAVNAPLMPNEQSLGEVLFGFFAHYAVLPIDQALCIATARFLPRPDAWKPDAFERFCILDPNAFSRLEALLAELQA